MGDSKNSFSSLESQSFTSVCKNEKLAHEWFRGAMGIRALIRLDPSHWIYDNNAGNSFDVKVYTMKRTFILPLSLVLIGITSPIMAQQEETTTEDSLERIESKIDRILDTSDSTSKAYIDQPLGERKFGVEFNFFRIIAWDEWDKSISGTFSIFNPQNNTEIAFPYMYSTGRHEYDDSYQLDDSLTSITVDTHIRKYLGHRLDGFYLSTFARLTRIEGLKGKDSDYLYPTPNMQFNKNTEAKLGVGIGIGYRIISSSGFYWGTSLSVGRYFVGKSDVFLDSESISANIDDQELIIDMEMLKFGYAF